MCSTYIGTDFSKFLCHIHTHTRMHTNRRINKHTHTHTHTHTHVNTHTNINTHTLTNTRTHSGDFPSTELLLATLRHYLALYRKSGADIARVKRDERLRALRLQVPICT